MTSRRFGRVTLMLGLALAAAAATAAEADLMATFNQADVVFTGTVASSRLGPAVGLSDPPVYTVIVTFDAVEMLRGDRPADLTFTRQVRTRQPPVYAKGTKLLVAASRHPYDPKRLAVSAMVEPTKENLALAKEAISLPVGWRYEGGRPVSPWAGQGTGAWPAGAKWKIPGVPVCSKTGRPALEAGHGITLKVEQVIPKDVKKYQNPFGDGEFTVTVTNMNKIGTDVPALLTDGGKIAWEQSLVILNGGRAHVLPGAAPLTDPKPARLKPGESASAVVNVLPLDGISWPRGGSRVLFTFCLGERTAPSFFYYFSRRHDPLREAALRKLKRE